MGFLSAYTGTTRVNIGSDYWVDLRKYITQGGQEAAEAALARVITVDGEAQPRPDVAQYRKLMVLAAVQDWNLDDDNGQPLKIDVQTIEKLPLPVFNKLWEQTQKNNSEAERSPEEQLDFRQ